MMNLTKAKRMAKAAGLEFWWDRNLKLWTMHHENTRGSTEYFVAAQLPGFTEERFQAVCDGVLKSAGIEAPKPKTDDTLASGWRVHTASLLTQVLDNPGTAILAVPLNILGKLLYQVAERASQLNDPELNALMCRLTLYEIADPEQPGYDEKVVDEVLKKAGMNVTIEVQK